MKKILMSFFIFISSCLQADDSSVILQKVDSFRVTYQQFLLKLNITTFEQNEKKETALFDVYINGKAKSLVVAKKYKTRRMKILYVGENMWVHLPNTRRPLRITPIQRLMGEASIGDVAKISYAEDYAIEPIGQNVITGILCRKLKLHAKKKSATYHKIILYSRQNDYRPVMAEYYLTSGKHFKTAFFDSYKLIDGKITLEKMTIYDELRPGNKTTFEYLNIEEKKLPAKYFNKN